MGIYLFVLSACFAFLQCLLPAFKTLRTSLVGQHVIESVSGLSFFAVSGAFCLVLYAFVQSDLSFLIVALNSHPSAELIYKISGVWGNHEGSLLLWLVLLCGFCLIMVLSNSIGASIRVSSIQIIGFISFSFHLFILLTANPFVQLEQVPTAGAGLNPLLEDPSLAIHPPILYAGLALLAIPFALTCSFLKQGGLSKSWALLIRPWVLASWCFITCGIALGSWWAYYELGWGGWWFWDPVENSSLLPWLTSTALIHTLIVVEKKGDQIFLAGTLALLGFVLSMFGFSLVRSGVLQSVHSFAVDYLRGYFFFAVTGFLALYGIRQLLRHKQKTEFNQYIFSRPSFIYINTLTLLCIMLLILLGTTYPLILKFITGQQVSVGAPYFNLVTSPFVLLICFGMIATPLLKWGETPSQHLIGKLGYIFSLGLFTFLLIAYFKDNWSLLNSLVLSAVFCVIISSLLDIFRKRKQLKTLGLRFYAMHIAHAGIAMLILGAILDKEGEKEFIYSIALNESVNVEGHRITLKDIEQIGGPYFQKETASLLVEKGKNNFILKPEKRYYALHEVITTETAIHPVGLADLYSVLGNYQNQDRWVVKFFWHPYVRVLWIASVLMIFAGLIAYFASLRSLRKQDL